MTHVDWHPYPEEKPKVPGRYLTMKYPSYEDDKDSSDLEVVISSWDCKRFYISQGTKMFSHGRKCPSRTNRSTNTEY